jgi:cyclopropane fatty-acyl-phospholipid synthase-like methyltransferase
VSAAAGWISNDSGWAPNVYERWFRWNPHQAALRRREERAVLAVLDSQPMETALEVGAGTGHYTLHLARRCEHVHATDSTPAMRAYLERRTNGAPNVSIGEARLPELEDVEGQFDVVLSVGVLNYLPDLGACLRSMAARSRNAVVFTVPMDTPGGRLYRASELLSRHKVWLRSPSEVDETAASAGLRIEHMERAGFTRSGLTLAVRAVKP